MVGASLALALFLRR